MAGECLSMATGQSVAPQQVRFALCLWCRVEWQWTRSDCVTAVCYCVCRSDWVGCTGGDRRRGEGQP